MATGGKTECKARVSYTTNRANLPTMASGNKTSSVVSASSTTSVLTKHHSPSTAPTSKTSSSSGSDLKVTTTHNSGSFKDDLKQGKGTLYFSNN